MLLLLALVLAAGASARAQSGEPHEDLRRSLLRDDTTGKEVEDLSVFSVGLEIFPATGGGSFFEEYRTLFSTVETLDAYVAPTVSGRVLIGDRFRFVFGASVLATGFTDIYNAYAPVSANNLDSLAPIAQIVDEFSAFALPVLVGVQYTPIRSQFTSYVGATVGGAIVNADWTTSVRPLENRHFFRPRTNTEGSSIAPAVRLFTGVDLRFDAFMTSENVFRGIYVEAAYLWLPVRRDFFREIRTLTQGTPFVPSSDDATINLGGFSLSIGANIQP